MSFVKLPVLRHGLMVRNSDILPDAIVAARIEKTRRLMSEKNVGALLVYSDPTRNGPACYLTNYPCFGMGRRATVALSMEEGPFLFTAEPSRNLPRVRLMTTCDIEKTRQFLSVGCERVRKLAKSTRIGLVGMANLPSGLVKDTAGLEGKETECLSRAFSALMASKDESALKATKGALALAEEGLQLIAEQAASGRDLWEMAAYADYRLRLAGCEDTNILLNSSAGGRMRPGYPDRRRPASGDILIACVAVQYARHWGITGSTLTVGADGDKLNAKLDLLRKAQIRIADEIKAGMTIDEVISTIREIGRQSGLPLAEDLPVAAGIGFDLHEYPLKAGHRLPNNTVLQVVLASDFAERFTGMLVNMLHVTNNGGIWLTGAA